jgi:Na+/H+ antiporter NhaC
MLVRASPRRLAVAIVAGPVAALSNQGSIYATSAMICGHPTRAPLHAIALTCLLISVGAAVFAIRGYKAIAGESADHVDEQQRTRFMTVVAASTAVFSSIVILAQWLAVVLFAPCMKT